ncbi:hypothetical protein AB1N83_012758 [Pleurotus pulmonarius]
MRDTRRTMRTGGQVERECTCAEWGVAKTTRVLRTSTRDAVRVLRQADEDNINFIDMPPAIRRSGEIIAYKHELGYSERSYDDCMSLETLNRSGWRSGKGRGGRGGQGLGQSAARGMYIVDLYADIDISTLSPGLRVGPRSGFYTLRIILPNDGRPACTAYDGREGARERI